MLHLKPKFASDLLYRKNEHAYMIIAGETGQLGV